MRLSMILAAGLLACAAPASPAAAESAAAMAPTPEAIEAELVNYGAWLVRFNRTLEPLQQAVTRLQQRWQQMSTVRDFNAAAEEFRPFVAGLIAEVDRSAAAVRALDTPSFPVLALDEDVRPASMVRDAERYTGQIRDLFEGYMPLLEAMRRNDAGAVERAGNQLLDSARLLIQSQVLMTRAMLATTPRHEAVYNVVEVQLIYFRAAERILSAWPGAAARRDAALAGDLLRFADELERSAAAGEARSDAQALAWRGELAAVERARDQSGVSILRRSLAVLAIGRRVFPLGRELAGMLRAAAPGFAGGQVRIPALGALMRQIQPLRGRLDEIARDEAAALAGN